MDSQSPPPLPRLSCNPLLLAITLSSFSSLSRPVCVALFVLQEDAKVLELVSSYGAKRWSLIASHLPGRIGKQCRERWYEPTRRHTMQRQKDVPIVCSHLCIFHVIYSGSFLSRGDSTCITRVCVGVSYCMCCTLFTHPYTIINTGTTT